MSNLGTLKITNDKWQGLHGKRVRLLQEESNGVLHIQFLEPAMRWRVGDVITICPGHGEEFIPENCLPESKIEAMAMTDCETAGVE